MSWVTHVRRTQNPQNTQSVSFSASAASSALIVVAFVIAFRGLAYAQSAVPAQGPMTIERVHSGFVVAPDVKVTEVDNTTSALAGAYAGWLTDDTFFIGGGGYWLANPDRDRKMAYGGLVLQWLTHTNSRVGFGAKALIGGGQATLETTVSQDFRLPDLPNIPAASQVFRDLDRLFRPPPSVRVRHDEGFFVAEPQVDLIVKLARQLRLNAGVGYRLISTEGRNDRRLRGATGSVALQIGGGS